MDLNMQHQILPYVLNHADKNALNVWCAVPLQRIKYR